MARQIDLGKAPTISLEEAKVAFDKGTWLFVDVRSREEFEQSHIPGAVSIPLKEISRRADELPPRRSVIFYWAWPHEEYSARAALMVSRLEVDAKALKGGVHGWQASGYPLEGEQPDVRIEAG